MTGEQEAGAIKCIWTLDKSDGMTYETSCGQAFILNAGTPTNNDFKFCVYCGKTLEEKKTDA